MTAKEYLMQVRNLDKLINVKLNEITQLKKQITSLQAVKLGEKVQSSCNYDSVQRTIEKIVDMQAEINAEVDKLVDLKTEVRKRLNGLNDNRFTAVLTDYYINGKTFEKIAEELNYSDRQLRRIYGNALQKFRELYKMS